MSRFKVHSLYQSLTETKTRETTEPKPIAGSSNQEEKPSQKELNFKQNETNRNQDQSMALVRPKNAMQITRE